MASRIYYSLVGTLKLSIYPVFFFYQVINKTMMTVGAWLTPDESINADGRCAVNDGFGILVVAAVVASVFGPCASQDQSLAVRPHRLTLALADHCHPLPGGVGGQLLRLAVTQLLRHQRLIRPCPGQSVLSPDGTQGHGLDHTLVTVWGAQRIVTKIQTIVNPGSMIFSMVLLSERHNKQDYHSNKMSLLNLHTIEQPEGKSVCITLATACVLCLRFFICLPWEKFVLGEGSYSNHINR